MSNLHIRLARAEDAAAMLEVYAPYVADTAASFEYAVPSPEEFSARIEERLAFYPVLALEEGDALVGYVYASRERAREAYGWNAELSIYIRGDCAGRGAGSALYAAVTELLAMQGICNAYGGVTVPNERSERLHLAAGFHLAGIHRATGWKLGEWRDVAWFEKRLGALDAPEPPRPFSALDPAAVGSVLEKANAMLK